MNKKTLLLLACFAVSSAMNAQVTNDGKKISSDLFGIFFEDINYSADGGLYAEMVQNRSFEYSPRDRATWNSLSDWTFITPGYSGGLISVETAQPICANNPHYINLEIEHIGNVPQYKGEIGVGLVNSGFEGMVVRSGDRYNYSLFARQLSGSAVTMKVYLENNKGEKIGESNFTTSSDQWKQYSGSIIPSVSTDSARLVVLATSVGKISLDMISLFPEKTFKNRSNGMRADLAQLLADMKPRFVRFPGGCLVHGGGGLGNMYRWKNSIGPLEQRKGQSNGWGYHQNVGLGYYEYFQLCEDIEAKPLPVVPAGVCCQNAYGTWRVGGIGQQGLPMAEMPEYVQEVLDLIEWANGPATSTWGAKRAAAGHPAPFGLEYIGIGNEDHITPEFKERFKMIYEAVKARYPKIKVIGTAGPFYEGDDYEEGWKFAKELRVPIVDEHYYVKPEWFVDNQHRYDTYKRGEGEVYLGEYASQGNKLINAISEAAYMTSLERNGDVVRMASYAPLFAKKNFTQWNPDLIYFDNTKTYPTVNYLVQKAFSLNSGDTYYEGIIKKQAEDEKMGVSCVRDSKTGDIILKIANPKASSTKVMIDLSAFKHLAGNGTLNLIAGNAEDSNNFDHPDMVKEATSIIKVKKNFEYSVPAMSLSVIRIKKK